MGLFFHMKKKVAIFIPAYNAAKTLSIVLDRIPPDIKRIVEEIFVIDDASSDSTQLVGIQYKKRSGLEKLKVYKNEINLGYGGNQKKAYQYSIKKDFDMVVMLHGDAQYAPEKLPALINGMIKKKADMVFGSRMKGHPLKGGMPLHKYIGNKILTSIENIVLNLNLSEYHSGYRIYSCKALKKIPFDLCSDDFHFDTEIIIQMKIAGMSIKEVPIPTRYGKERCHVNLISYAFNIIKSLVEYLIHCSKIKRYKKFVVPPQ